MRPSLGSGPHNQTNGQTPPLLPGVPSPAAEQAAPIKLTAIVSILWRRLWLIILCTLLAAFAGWLYVRNVTPMYRSTARIFVDRVGPVIVSKSIDTDMLLQAGNFRRTQAEIIKSLAVVARLKDNVALREAGGLRWGRESRGLYPQGPGDQGRGR